ncbi:MAG TPA: radical SAM protein [Rectinemataceae bacterium]|nr:radical SAM protein [Rectinemataceae bacterium]
MESIARKTLLYKSGLGFFCVNPVQGCSHGCRYPCYAYMMARSYGRAKTYAEWCAPKLVSNAAEVLEKELDRKRALPDIVNFSLTTDPFMVGYPEVAEMSMRLIALINSRGIPCSILSKGILPRELADRERFPAENIYGISLISLDEGFRRRWEPGAAPYADRIRALRILHDGGRRTLVHMEPYPTPNFIEQDLGEILKAIGFADSVYFGGWNYNAEARGYPRYREFYQERTKIVRDFCAARGIACDLGKSR